MGLISRVSSRTYRLNQFFSKKWLLEILSSERFSLAGRNRSQPRTSNPSTSPKYRGTTWTTHKVHFVIHSKVPFTSPISFQPKAPAPKTTHLLSQLETSLG